MRKYCEKCGRILPQDVSGSVYICSMGSGCASFPVMTLDIALEFADSGKTKGCIMTKESLSVFAKSIREISIAAKEVAAQLEIELKIKPTANRHMAEKAIKRLYKTLPKLP